MRAKALAKKPMTQRRYVGVDYPDEMECRSCGKVKPKSLFGVRRGSYKGRTYLNRSCLDCTGHQDRDYRLRHHYGIGVDEFIALHKAQDGRCALCRMVPQKRMTGWLEMPAWSVDHDHATGRIRGLLCQGCNVAVGFFETRIDIEQMRAYLSP